MRLIGEQSKREQKHLSFREINRMATGGRWWRTHGAICGRLLRTCNATNALLSLGRLFGKRNLQVAVRLNSWKAAHSILGIAIILGFASSSRAQVDRAGLNGTVTDPSGHVLPQTHITAVKNDTGLSRETDSSLRGTYDIPELPVGVYTVTFVHQACKILSFENVAQVVGQTPARAPIRRGAYARGYCRCW
jgi:hypothetical protein